MVFIAIIKQHHDYISHLSSVTSCYSPFAFGVVVVFKFVADVLLTSNDHEYNNISTLPEVDDANTPLKMSLLHRSTQKKQNQFSEMA